MRKSIGSFLTLLAAMWAAGPVLAQDTGAVNPSGNWATASNWTGGTVPGASNNVYIGSTYPTGAASTATVTLTANESASNVYLGNGSSTSGTLDLGGNTLKITNSLVIGQNSGTGTLNEGGGSFTATNAYVENGNSLTFGAKDAVGYLELDSKTTATTAALGNVTGGVGVFGGSTLNLGAALNLTGNLDVRDTGTVVNLNGNAVTANTILLGYYNGSAVTLNRGGAGGTLTATNLEVGNTSFNLLATDKVTNYYLTNAQTTLNSDVAYLQLDSKSTATTTASGNVTGGVGVFGGSTLNLGADLNLTGNLDLRDTGTTLNANGHAITADTLYAGNYNSSAVTLTDLGKVTLNDLFVNNGTSLTLHGGDVIGNQLTLSGNSILTVDQVGGTGLTLNGTSLSNLTIDPSQMDLVFTSTTPGSWDFRWKDPSSTNWISTLDTMIKDGQIVLSGATTYSVVDQNGYTYIEGYTTQSVPEPSSIVLMCLAGAGMAAGAAWRRRRQSQ